MSHLATSRLSGRTSDGLRRAGIRIALFVVWASGACADNIARSDSVSQSAAITTPGALNTNGEIVTTEVLPVLDSATVRAEERRLRASPIDVRLATLRHHARGATLIAHVYCLRTVSRVSSGPYPIVTDVTLEFVSTIRGVSPSTRDVTVAGGRVGDDFFFASEVGHYEDGRNYLGFFFRASTGELSAGFATETDSEGTALIGGIATTRSEMDTILAQLQLEENP